MRKLLLSLALVTLVAGACGSASRSGGYTAAPDPAASPYGGVTFDEPGINPLPQTGQVDDFLSFLETVADLDG